MRETHFKNSVRDKPDLFLEEGFALKVVSKSEFDAFKLAKVAVFIQENSGSTIKDLTEKLGISYKSSQRYLRILFIHGIVTVGIIKNDGAYRYYPNPSKMEFFKLARSLIELLERISTFLEE
jgi:predicted transcriptional regulator